MVRKERLLSVEELDIVCAAFLKLPGMREPSSRDLYIDILNGQLANALSISRHLDARHDVWALLRACQDHPGGIRALTAIVRSFYRDSRPMIELDELVECLFPDELLEPAEREQLAELLGGVEPPMLQRASVYAGSTPWLNTALDWADPAAVIGRLESCIGRAGDPAPLLVFVDFVAHQLDSVRGAQQHRWIDQVGARLELPAPGLRELCVAAAARLEEVRRSYFIMQLQRDGIDPDGFLMSVWLQRHHATEVPLHRGEAPVTLSEIAERLPDLLGQAHSALDGRIEELTLEFILPRSLIGHPVDQWLVDPVFPHRLGTSYPVVVRSVDRLHNRKLHASWRSKWRWLQLNGHREQPEAIYWLTEPGGRAPSLRATLLANHSLVALAMAFAPKDSFDLTIDELTAALYAGVPVIVWCRDTALSPTFESDIRELLINRGLAELPAQILNLRQRADETDEESVPHLGRHVTLLWDDADRIPGFGRLQAPQ